MHVSKTAAAVTFWGTEFIYFLDSLPPLINSNYSLSNLSGTITNIDRDPSVVWQLTINYLCKDNIYLVP